VAGGIERGEVRLFRFPPPDKARPVLVLTRSTAIRYLSRVTIAPISSTLRGVPSEIALGIEDGMKQDCAVNLHNLITVPQDAVGPLLTRLSEERMRQVCGAIGFALGCD
jgi:mRNA interferase MazF